MGELCTDIKDLPLVLKVEDLVRILSAGKGTVYELLRSGAIRSVRVGRSYRISKEAVLDFLQKTS